MPETIDVPDFNSIARGLMNDVVTYASVTGVNFFRESFDKQGFTDTNFEAWPHRASGDDGRAILMRTGYLRDSTQVLEASIQQIVFGNTAIYASAHNEGATISISVTPKARKYFWYMFKATKQVKWKYMALTKKSKLTIKIPKRQFIGESKTLMTMLDEWIMNQIITRFNNV